MVITEEFRKIWELAEELAEKEVQQYNKAPYEITEKVPGICGKVKFVYRRQSPTEYKDKARQNLIVGMVALSEIENTDSDL